MVSTNRGGRRYQEAVRALRARGDAYCWRGCGRFLRADISNLKTPGCMTLGHIVAREEAPDLFWDPENHAPECVPCNMGDGARRTNAKRRAARGERPAERVIRSSPHWE